MLLVCFVSFACGLRGLKKSEAVDDSISSAGGSRLCTQRATLMHECSFYTSLPRNFPECLCSRAAALTGSEGSIIEAIDLMQSDSKQRAPGHDAPAQYSSCTCELHRFCNSGAMSGLRADIRSASRQGYAHYGPSTKGSSKTAANPDSAPFHITSGCRGCLASLHMSYRPRQPQQSSPTSTLLRLSDYPRQISPTASSQRRLRWQKRCKGAFRIIASCCGEIFCWKRSCTLANDGGRRKGQKLANPDSTTYSRGGPYSSSGNF